MDKITKQIDLTTEINLIRGLDKPIKSETIEAFLSFLKDIFNYYLIPKLESQRKNLKNLII